MACRTTAPANPTCGPGSCHIMQLKQHADGTDFDPREPRNWTVPEPILDSDGGMLNPVQRISLDMTVISDSGRWYYAWQQVGSIWIAGFDPSWPRRGSTSRPRQIVVPEFAWDNMIAEGPNAIVHEGRIFLIYSGSLVGIDYTTGLVAAPAGANADLTDPAAWTKLDYPLQKSGVYNGRWRLAPVMACGRTTRTAISFMCSITPSMRTGVTAVVTHRCGACIGPRKACRFWICSQMRNLTRVMLI